MWSTTIRMADMVRQLLEGEACTVDVARDGREALRAIAERPPDAVLDLLMPGLDGLPCSSNCRQTRAGATSR